MLCLLFFSLLLLLSCLLLSRESFPSYAICHYLAFRFLLFLPCKQLVLLVVFFFSVFGFWAFEAAAVPVLQTQKDAWSIQQNFFLFLWIGALYVSIGSLSILSAFRPICRL